MMQLTEIHEQCVCTSCQQAIGREYVTREHDRENGLRRLLAFCEFCDLLLEETSRLCGGFWVVTDAVAVVADPAKREAFLGRLALLKGDVRLAARAAQVPDNPEAIELAIDQTVRKLAHLYERKRRATKYRDIATPPVPDAAKVACA